MVYLNVLEVIKEVDGSFIIKLLKWVEGWVENKLSDSQLPEEITGPNGLPTEVLSIETNPNICPKEKPLNVFYTGI